MEKITFKELEERKDWEEAVIVFTKDSFDKDYTEEERSYKVSHSSNWFNGGKTISFALWGNCLDGKDLGVRLDWYLKNGKDSWKVDYCYIIK